MLSSTLPIPETSFLEQYGQDARLCPCSNDQIRLVFSQTHPFDLVELEQLLEAVGWSRRPVRRVRKALQHSLLTVGLWRHDPRIPLSAISRPNCPTFGSPLFSQPKQSKHSQRAAAHFTKQLRFVG